MEQDRSPFSPPVCGAGRGAVAGGKHVGACIDAMSAAPAGSVGTQRRSPLASIGNEAGTRRVSDDSECGGHMRWLGRAPGSMSPTAPVPTMQRTLWALSGHSLGAPWPAMPAGQAHHALHP